MIKTAQKLAAFFKSPTALISKYKYLYSKASCNYLNSLQEAYFIPIFSVSSLYMYKNSFDHCKILHSRCIC